MKRKILSLFTAAAMLISLIGAMPLTVSAGTSASGIQIGDYVQMGTYYDASILWRCVAFEKITGYDTNGNPITDSTDTVTTYQDGYLPLMISDKILCLKAFDAKTSVNTKTGSHSRDKNRNSGTYNCSNYWADSNIRCWLNSDAAAGNVEWLCGNPPVSGTTSGVKYNAYDQEAGFLTSFSGDEKAAIKTVTQKSILIECDKNAAANVTGTAVFTTTAAGIGNISGNYAEAYSEQVTDTMFLPDVQQMSNLYSNKTILGDGYHRAKISAGAYNAGNCVLDAATAFTNSSPWHYWLRTPSSAYSYNIYNITNEGGVGGTTASTGLYGVRPAFYLNTAAALAGSGTAEAPYTIEHQHNLVKHDAVPATCTDDGTDEYYTCEGSTGCGKMFSDAEGTTEISAIPTLTSPGHSWGSWYITSEPTFTATGEAERVCKNNGEHTEEAVLPVLTNTDVWTPGTLKPATCDKSGSVTYNSIYGNVKITLPQTDHSWGSWTITTEPTSTTGGTAERVCTKNSTHIDTVELPVLTDTEVWTAGTKTEPTETTDGSQTYTSTYGNVTVVLPATGHTHDWGEWELTTEPTEEKTGITTRVCKDDENHKETKEVPELTDDGTWEFLGGSAPTCTTEGSAEYDSVEYGTVKVIYPATGHSWGDWSITTEPTLTETGEAERVCANNSAHKDTMTLPVLTNTTVWTAGAKTEPTCTADGSQTYTSIYGDVTITLSATGHDWGSWSITLEPTLTETGTAERVCANDSAHKGTVTLPVLTNTTVWTAGARVEPTESTDGSQIYTSEYGNITFILPAIGHTHDWGEWSITTKPTETTTGIATRVCKTNSEHTESVTLSVLTDTKVWSAGTKTDPTETTDGSQTYTSEYGTVTVVFPATGHVWGDWSIAIKPTLETEGLAQRTCTIDSAHKDTVTLPVLTNTTVWIAGAKTDPTCTADGSQTYTSIYGDVTITLSQTGHSWGSWSITVEPTETTEGTAERVCTINSAHKDTKVLPVLTDTDVWTAGARVEPTETTDGSQIYTSEYGNVTVVLPATGHTHDWDKWSITTEPTETETGIATRVCKTNAAHKDTVTLPVLTDTDVWVAGTRVEPTETTDGSQEYISIYGKVTVVIPALKYSVQYIDGNAFATVPEAGTYTVIFAAYGSNNELVSVEFFTIPLNKGKNSICPSVFNPTGASRVKVMLWDSIDAMKPLCVSDEQ